MISKSPEKVSFTERDCVPLHSLPSAQAEDPIIVHTPKHRNSKGRILRLLVRTGYGIVILLAGLVLLVQGGFADGYLGRHAGSTLQRAVSQDFTATVGSMALRFTRHGNLAVLIENVMLTPAASVTDIRDAENADAMPLASVKTIRLMIWPGAVLTGDMKFDAIEVDGANIAWAGGADIDFASLRVSALSTLHAALFERIDQLHAQISRFGIEKVTFRDTRLTNSANGQEGMIETLELAGIGTDKVTVKGDIAAGKIETALLANLAVDTATQQAENLDLSLSGLDLEQFIRIDASTGKRDLGLASILDVNIRASRDNGAQTFAAQTGAKPELALSMMLSPGMLYVNRERTAFDEGALHFSYDFGRKTIDMDERSRLVLDKTVLPLSGGAIDISAMSARQGQGIAFQLLTNDARASVATLSGVPLPFSARLSGAWRSDLELIQIDDLIISTTRGSLAGSVQIRPAPRAPEISFAATIGEIKTDALKKLWPFWVAPRPRDWILANLHGGTVRSGSLRMFIPAGKLALPREQRKPEPHELQVDLELEGSRINVAGDIPPLRGATGELSLRGDRLDVAIHEGISYFPSGQSVNVSDARVLIADGRARPLMADLDLRIDGPASAVAELVSFKPIDILSKTPYVAEDFTGQASAHVVARFGLVTRHNPPPPEWSANIDLRNVTVAKPIDDRLFSNITGNFQAESTLLKLDADAVVDDLAVRLSLVEPINEGVANPAIRQRIVTAQLSDEDRDRLLPGLKDFVKGPATVKLTRRPDGSQEVEANLTDVSLYLPGIAWTKGRGIGATLTLLSRQDEGQLRLEDIVLEGEGFSLQGKMTVADDQIVSGAFPNVQLSSRDAYGVTIARLDTGTYQIDIDGSWIDLRSAIERLRNPTSANETQAANDGDGSGAMPLVVHMRIDNAIGFKDERLSNFNLTYAGQGSRVDTLSVTAATSGQRAVLANFDNDETGHGNLAITSGDAGAVARFTNLYSHINGGLLNVQLDRASSQAPYVGIVDIRDFTVVGEERLRSLVKDVPEVSSRSLETTIRREIDVETAVFNQASVRLVAGQGTISISEGILRGQEIGLAIQGTVRDPAETMNLNGTLLPAYGINSLLSNVPLLGGLFGNGSDRGLIGITFRLSGPVENPRLEINPLSVIAPGIFRSVFEYAPR